MDKYDLRELDVYVETFRTRCEQMQERQSTMERKFNKAVESWRDEIYKKVNTALYETAKCLKKVYDGIHDTVYALSQAIDKLDKDYHETKAFNARTNISEFHISIKGVIEMPKEIIEVDPQALVDFGRELREYISETRAAISNIEREHANMGAYWKGRHYDEFEVVLKEVKIQIGRQLSLLETYNIYISSKHGILEQVLGKTINKMGQ